MPRLKIDEDKKKVTVTLSLSPEVAKGARIQGAMLNLTRSSWIDLVLKRELQNEQPTNA